ncbi:MAG: hypothetical protein LQ346_005152 [Caloplaca aetnensis]|nr:MAG: hypothetical protein LQ346_005152 [Caloplaca aetnensis]
MAANDIVSARRRRLLRDIAEVQKNPYPNIAFHVQDSLEHACLILSPEDSKPLHLTMTFGHFPFAAPQVTIQSYINHPNVFDSYICASILNTAEGYTPAYTLKSIAIQLLSFFCSDSLDQGHGVINLKDYRQTSRRWPLDGRNCRCAKCGFDDTPPESIAYYRLLHSEERQNRRTAIPVSRADAETPGALSRLEGAQRNRMEENIPISKGDEHAMDIDPHSPVVQVSAPPTGVQLGSGKFLDLPDEILLMVFSELSAKDLWAATQVFPGLQRVLHSYDFIRIREQQCFCSKESFLDVKLGVGVHVALKGREGTLESEFDLLSDRAFDCHGVKTSVQGLGFEHWLPLPISRRHWRRVRKNVEVRFLNVGYAAKLANPTVFDVLCRFMNDVVVKFNREAERSYGGDPRSTLSHASEKAVEAYFALFHLLLCVATEHASMIRRANEQIAAFLQGGTSKTACPNLGHLLVAALISDDGLTEDLTFAIIKESILRNVIWMLDSRGAGMAELSYLEPSAVSDYRLIKTFQASRTSYRLLMFFSLFSRSARIPGKSLETIRDDMFDAHGAPPRGMASHMAAEIRRIKEIDGFPPFLKEMGLRGIPQKAEFSCFLKRMVTHSAEVGYSSVPVTQGQALAMRLDKEPGVEVAEGVVAEKRELSGRLNFFPPAGNTKKGARGGPGHLQRGGSRGRGRGH